MTFRRPPTVLALVVLFAVGLAACEPHTVAIRFDPAVGDRYRFRSDIATSVERTIDGESAVEDDAFVLEAMEHVVGVDDDEIRVEVTLERDGTTTRSYEVRFDRGDRLTAIDLVEGVPADALGLDLADDLPTDVASPPAGPLEPGATWTIDRSVEIAGQADPVTVRGDGRVDSLGVVDGEDVAVTVVELVVPLRDTIETTDGIVTISGEQSTTSRTTYDLADGAARTDHTEITGSVDIEVQPPDGVIAEPVAGVIEYRITVRTERVRALDRAGTGT